MAIQVFCNCGNSLSVGVELAGKKVRCKGCGEVLRIPDVPLDESAEEEPSSGPADYEVVSAAAASISCPVCGATASPEDTACLACGAELGRLARHGVLSKVPPKLLLGGSVALGLIILFAIGKSVWTSTRPGSFTSDGLTYLSREDYEASRTAFETALKYDRDYDPAKVGLANLGVISKNNALIKRYGREVLRKKLVDDEGERAAIRVAYGWLSLEDRDLGEAISQAAEGMEEDSNVTGEAKAIMGLAYLAQGKQDEAVKYLDASMSSRYTNVRVCRELAQLHKTRQEYEKGAAAAERAVRLDETDSSLWLLVADLQSLAGNPDAVANALLQAVKQDAGNAVARSRLSQIYLQQGKTDRALEEAKKAAEAAPNDSEVLIALGRALIADDNAEAAKAPLERALNAQRSWEAEFLLGRVLCKTGDPRGGVQRIQSALNKQPDNAALHLQAARIALEEANLAPKAASILTNLVAKDARNYDARVLLARSLSRLANGRKRNDEKIRAHLQAAIEIDGTRRDAPFALGLHEFEMLRPRMAIKAFDAGLESNSRDRDLLYYKGWACVRAKLWDEAISALEACVAAAPNFQDAKDKLEEANEGKFYNQNR